jgi:hypothetical protein
MMTQKKKTPCRLCPSRVVAEQRASRCVTTELQAAEAALARCEREREGEVRRARAAQELSELTAEDARAGVPKAAASLRQKQRKRNVRPGVRARASGGTFRKHNVDNAHKGQPQRS